jgi:hypothetical protein
VIRQSPWGAAGAVNAGRDAYEYDEIGARVRAAAPKTGPLPLQTIPDLRREREVSERVRLPGPIQDILDQADRMPHRPIELPKISGRMSYEIRGHVIHVTYQEGGPGRPEVWSFPLNAPPAFLTEHAEDDDEAMVLTQTHRVRVPGGRWLPLPRLIAAGRMARMQDWSDQLVADVEPGQLCLFLSHRWLTPDAPDPAGGQSAMAAWQIFAAACEAVRIAHQRGLHRPRRRHAALGIVVGPAGSTLAEAILVNVLRPTVPEADVGRLYAETADLEPTIADHGVAAAREDTGLSRLRELMAGRPLTNAILGRILLWYDYACMPQRPHGTVDEETEFQQALRNLTAYQAIGRTVVLLDDADAHLTRAWCTLEALAADSLTGTMDVLVGSHQAAGRSGGTEHHLVRALEDRPHVVWRGLLDTEVFGLQTPEECMTRLGLTATQLSDLPVVYAHLTSLGAPRKAHVDDMEVVTGTFPLPVVDRGATVVVPAESGRPVGALPPTTGSLDWTGALRPRAEPRVDAAQPSWQRLGPAGAHAVVVAACEGEAVLVTDWLRRHIDQLATVAGAPIATVSWLSSDIGPVGHRPDGLLRTVTVDADRWVLVTTSMRFQHCTATAAILKAVNAAGLTATHVSIDVPSDNVRPLPNDRRDDRRVVRHPARSVQPVELPGGAFRAGLIEVIRSTVGGRS